MKENPNNLEGKLVESMKIDGLSDLAQKYMELGLDLITENGIMRDIPIVGTIVNISKAVGSIRDWLYLKKLGHFLEKIGETTQEQREKFIEDNCQDTKKFEGTILFILEQSDRIEKSYLIGKIFKACILGKINLQEAIRLSEMVNRAFWEDLSYLLKDTESPWQKQKLYLAGFYDYDANYSYRDVGIGDLKVKNNYYTSAIKLIYQEEYEKLERNPLIL